MTYRTRPTEVEAFRLIIGAMMPAWFASALGVTIEPIVPEAPPNRWGEEGIVVHGAEGLKQARVGDWVVRHPSGGLTVCDDATFLATYEVARG